LGLKTYTIQSNVIKSLFFPDYSNYGTAFLVIELKQVMPEDRMNLQSEEGENVEGKENAENVSDERFESDTQKIIHRHLENKDDIITDEDIANVRVGMTPPQLDEATEARFENEEARENVEDDLLEGTKDMNKDENLDKGQMTPWDVIDPTK
jgi:hypothetical protein